MQNLSDGALLAAIAQDDRAAFRVLTQRYLNKIWRLSYRVMHNEQDAEDVTQEVFVTVWNNRYHWREGEAAFSTWLYRVAVNRSIDFRRKRRPDNTELTEEIAESEDIAADDSLASRELKEMLMRCLKALPEKQMLAMLYYYYEEMDIADICVKMNTTEDSVRSLLKRVRFGMKEIVGNKLDAHHWHIQRIAPHLRS